MINIINAARLQQFTWVIAVFFACQIGTAQAACEKGLQPHGEYCVSQRMSDYIACIEISGGNKSEVDHDISEALSDASNGSAKGSGSGLVVKGDGSLNVSKQGEKVLSDHLIVKYHDGAMAECNEALKNTDPGEKKSERYDWQKDVNRLAEIYSGNAYCDKYKKQDTQCINTTVGTYHLKNGLEEYANTVNVNADTISVHMEHWRKNEKDQDVVAVAKLEDLKSNPRLFTGNYYDGSSDDHLQLDCLIGECVRWSGWQWVSERPGTSTKAQYSLQQPPVMQYMDIPVINNVDEDLIFEMRRILARLIAPDHKDAGEIACQLICGNAKCAWITDDCDKKL